MKAKFLTNGINTKIFYFVSESRLSCLFKLFYTVFTAVLIKYVFPFLENRLKSINLFKVTNLGRDSVDRWECRGSFQGINSTLKTSHRMHVSFCRERQKVFIQCTWFHVVPRLSTHIKYPQMKKKKVFKSHPWLCGKRINVVKILGLFEMHRRVIMMLWIRKVKLALGMKGRTWKFRVYCQS